MTREEAILHMTLRREELRHSVSDLDEDIKAFDMAIKALEQKSILDKIRTEIEQLPTTKCTETHRIYIDAYDFKKNVLMILDKYKADSEVTQ